MTQAGRGSPRPASRRSQAVAIVHERALLVHGGGCDAYGAKSVETLRREIANGWKDRHLLRSDSYAALHGRADHERFCEELNRLRAAIPGSAKKNVAIL